MATPSITTRKPSPTRQRMIQVREDVIVDVVNSLLADKGYDAMTVDEVAAQAGISKTILYKHFRSKEALAATAMVKVLNRAIEHCQSPEVNKESTALRKVRAIARWTLHVQLAGAMPALPSQNSTLRTFLMKDKAFTESLFSLSDILGTWITEAQSKKQLDASLPPEVILYTLFARACDPVLQTLKSTNLHTDDEIVAWIMRTCFTGLEH